MTAPRPAPVLEAQDVTKTYRGGDGGEVRVLAGASLQVAPGEIFVAFCESPRGLRGLPYLALCLSRDQLHARVAVRALRMALAQRRPAPALIVHSDRGTQFASAEFGSALAAHRLTASMSRPAKPMMWSAPSANPVTCSAMSAYCR